MTVCLLVVYCNIFTCAQHRNV